MKIRQGFVSNSSSSSFIISTKGRFKTKEVDFDYDKSYCKNKDTHKRLMQWDYDCHLWKTRLGVLCPICDHHKLKRKEKLEKIKNKIKK